MDLQNKVAIVTGASKGIGKAIAHAMGKAGAKVVVSSRKQPDIDAVVEEFKAEGIEALAVACNVGKRDQLAPLLEQTEKAFGGIDILVNNAGTSLSFGPVLKTEDWAYDKTFDVNLRGPYELSRLVHPYMKTRGGGSIINISSVEGLHPSPGLGVYSVTKAALIMVSQVCAREWGIDGIRVNTICPGYIKTKLSETLMTNDQVYKMIMAKQSLQHNGQPQDIGGLSVFLASDSSVFVTGAVITADGGMTI